MSILEVYDIFNIIAQQMKVRDIISLLCLNRLSYSFHQHLMINNKTYVSYHALQHSSLRRCFMNIIIDCEMQTINHIVHKVKLINNVAWNQLPSSVRKLIVGNTCYFATSYSDDVVHMTNSVSRLFDQPLPHLTSLHIKSCTEGHIEIPSGVKSVHIGKHICSSITIPKSVRKYVHRGPNAFQFTRHDKLKYLCCGKNVKWTEQIPLFTNLTFLNIQLCDTMLPHISSTIEHLILHNVKTDFQHLLHDRLKTLKIRGSFNKTFSCKSSPHLQKISIKPNFKQIILHMPSSVHYLSLKGYEDDNIHRMNLNHIVTLKLIDLKSLASDCHITTQVNSLSSGILSHMNCILNMKLMPCLRRLTTLSAKIKHLEHAHLDYLALYIMDEYDRILPASLNALYIYKCYHSHSTQSLFKTIQHVKVNHWMNLRVNTNYSIWKTEENPLQYTFTRCIFPYD